MADLEKTVKIIFEGEDKALTKSIAGVAGQFDQISAIAGQVAAPLAAAADSVLKLDAALAALVVGGLALAIKESSDFNKGFALISTSIDATGQDLAKYRDDVLAYSTTSVKSASAPKTNATPVVSRYATSFVGLISTRIIYCTSDHR